jgi:riboflavin kinase/FMN adenylyltransferase
VLDFSGDLYGKRIELIFHKRLRPEKKFDTLEALILAIAEDVVMVRKHLRWRRSKRGKHTRRDAAYLE